MGRTSQPQSTTKRAPVAPSGAPASAAPSSKKFDKIKASPKADWEMSDIASACQQLGIKCAPPTRGTHHKVTSTYVDGVCLIPHNKPIKVVYIKSFIGFVEAHIRGAQANGGRNV